jgi:hypothetical protein
MMSSETLLFMSYCVGGSAHIRHVILFYFHRAPAISITILIILIYFDQFNLFWSTCFLIHFVSGIEIAKTFWSCAIHFNLFRYKIKIAKIKPVRHPARYPHGRMHASHSWFLHLPANQITPFQLDFSSELKLTTLIIGLVDTASSPIAIQAANG